MCLTAMYFAGIDTVYYGEAAEAGLGKAEIVYEDLQKSREARQIQMVHMPFKEGQENPMKMWKEK